MDASEPRTGTIAEPAAATVGQALRNARSARSLSIEQLATELRIEAPHLEALERNDFERIGPPVFVKGYLRHYGQRLGLTYNDLLGMYYAQSEAREVVVQPSRTIKLRDERQITVWIVAAVILVALGVAFAVWWVNNDRPVSFSRAASGVAASSETAAVAPSGVEARPEPVAAPAAPAAEAEPRANPAELFAAAAAAAREPLARSAAARAEPADADSVANGENPAAAPPVPAGALAVVLVFREESWAEVTAHDGTRLFYGLGTAGRRAALAGTPPIDVLLGNAGGVDITVDGAPWPIPGGRVNRARFTLAARATTAN